MKLRYSLRSLIAGFMAACAIAWSGRVYHDVTSDRALAAAVSGVDSPESVSTAGAAVAIYEYPEIDAAIHTLRTDDAVTNAITCISKYLDATHPRIRRQAIYAIGRLAKVCDKDELVTGMLRPLADDVDSEVARCAKITIARLQGRSLKREHDASVREDEQVEAIDRLLGV